MPPANQKAQVGLLKEFGAKVYHMIDPNQGHGFGDDVPRRIITYLYENLPNSGIKPGDPSKGKTPGDWRHPNNGVFTPFLQTPYLNAALKEYEAINGKKFNEKTTGIGKWGYLYYPHSCADKSAPKKCKFMIVSHGAGGQAFPLTNKFGPYGPNHEVIMLFA